MFLRNAIRGGIVFFTILILFSGVHGNGINGGRGLTYVKSAWNLKPGYLTMYGRSQVWGQVAAGTLTSVAVWDIQGALSLNYGVSEHIELAISPIMYQDTQRGEKKYMVPGDLVVGLKFGSFNLKGGPMTWGISFDTRFPTGEDFNIAFEPYSANTITWGFTGTLSYSKDPLYPDENLNVDFNLGYVNHNDIGQELCNDPNDPFSVSAMTQQLLYGLGIKIPTPTFDFTVEIYGNSFIQKPPKETAYSLENYFYLTPGINYRASRWLTLKVGADLRLSSNTDETTYQYKYKKYSDDLPNYVPWRLNVGFNIFLLPTTVFKVSDKDVLIRKAQSRRQLFEQIINEQQETESAEEELERIKSERQKAEKELERLRRILEGDQKKKKTKEPPPG
ncbi:hypothetical protein H8E88_06710 [candidate division KSB1 bacterium]|nr:hypothetical protein [candidate division KSB1 bacterium]MBL7093409.1 hypothetical protein [candidate division KSB1 bacterium]